MTLDALRIALPLLCLSAVAIGCDGTAPAASCGDGDTEGSERLICAATRGGDGGPAGGVHITTRMATTSQVLAELERVTEGAGGRGGLGGASEYGPPGDDGVSATEPSELSAVQLDTFSFDGTQIDGDARIDIAGGAGTNVIALDDTSSPPELRVRELRVRTGAFLRMSCDSRIFAESIVIEAGAVLDLRSQADGGCAIGVGPGDPVPGQRGLAVHMEARTLVLDGTIDLGGADGEDGWHGGAGGELSITAESTSFGPDARIVVAGGLGGDGQSEAPC